MDGVKDFYEPGAWAVNGTFEFKTSLVPFQLDCDGSIEDV